MNCWHCKLELIWGGNFEIEEDDIYCMVTNSCPKCESYVEVYLPKEIEKETNGKT